MRFAVAPLLVVLAAGPGGAEPADATARAEAAAARAEAAATRAEAAAERTEKAIERLERLMSEWLRREEGRRRR